MSWPQTTKHPKNPCCGVGAGGSWPLWTAMVVWSFWPASFEHRAAAAAASGSCAAASRAPASAEVRCALPARAIACVGWGWVRGRMDLAVVGGTAVLRRIGRAPVQQAAQKNWSFWALRLPQLRAQGQPGRRRLRSGGPGGVGCCCNTRKIGVAAVGSFWPCVACTGSCEPERSLGPAARAPSGLRPRARPPLPPDRRWRGGSTA
jgi:hypothetical protein